MNLKIAIIVVVIILVFWMGLNYMRRPRLTFHYATWCPHCTTMRPYWEKAKSQFGTKITMLEVEESPLVDAYPTIIYDDGVNKETYPGGKTYGDFVAWVNKNLNN